MVSVFEIDIQVDEFFFFLFIDDNIEGNNRKNIIPLAFDPLRVMLILRIECYSITFHFDPL